MQGAETRPGRIGENGQVSPCGTDGRERNQCPAGSSCRATTSSPMPRTVTLFTGQWADLSLAELAPLAKKMGYDGVELACWGDHFDVDAAAAAPKKYFAEKWQLLADHGLSCHAISNHLVGQAVCDNIDERHKSILSPAVWGDGNPEGVRKRAAKQLGLTAKMARAFFDARPGRAANDATPAVVNGFHRLLDLALDLCVSADLAGVLGCWIR
jgi:hypothetical protein